MKACAVCGKPFAPPARGTRVCSPACRVERDRSRWREQAERQRKKARPRKKGGEPAPLPTIAARTFRTHAVSAAAIDALVAAVNAEAARRGTFRPTVREMVAVAVSRGWAPPAEG